jgi:branched-subunit amino acid transport protein AzlD
MFNDQELLDKYFRLCDKLGINSVLLPLLISLLLSIYCLKDIKKWESISNYAKFFDIMIWLSLFMWIYMLVLGIIQGY